ncbi:hypothetical protein L6164_029134 [Bauhinia variegata]|uniref:Uncharacterized protein n=1 Tax=Bauhinia variegata TaxID=167791 RepID=A0ACB9L8P7_BAUVA|nr:hypothetical protein L6164_029134 [Bauhinia variegata]
MGRREKLKSKVVDDEGGSEDDKGALKPVIIVSSDDEEANEDLSLKIVEKALQMRAAKQVPDNGILDEPTSGGKMGMIASSFSGSGLVVPDEVASGVVGLGNEEIKIEKKKKKKKVTKVESGKQSPIIIEEEEEEEVKTVETIKDVERDEPAEANTVQMGDNMVLRKLLRGPRYFDPPDSGWGACFNCGEEGHAAVNCTAAKRKKPCFVCGSLEHNVKQCTKARDCFICKEKGHRAKDCPEKNKAWSKSSTICLKCGNSGHDMFSCKNDYSLDDLKEIQCYVCKKFGHLCCVSSDDATPGEVSCYKCGQLGHTGLACSRLRGVVTDAATPSSCYKCGEEGHFARECLSSAKKSKRKMSEWSNPRTPTLKFHKEKDSNGYKSTPHDMGKARKKKKVVAEDRSLTTPKKSKRRGGGLWIADDPDNFSFTNDFSPRKSKRRGGWITEDPREYSPSKSRRTNWRRSPAKAPSFSGSKSSKKMWHAQNSQGSAKAYYDGSRAKHRFSASRFGGSSSDGPRRNFDWW